MDRHVEYWLKFSLADGIGLQDKIRLITLLEDPEQIFKADRQVLRQLGLNPNQVDTLHCDNLSKEADRIMELCLKQKIRIIPLCHDEYPEMLKYIHDPPLLLYARGTVPGSPFVAVVGSRKASGYGMETAKKLSSELAASGVTIVSGMARGIDTASHCGALKTGGLTVAVLGCGVDTVYPPENKALMERIIQKGAVISEYPPGTHPAAFHFPLRNRIISGMSLGTLVIEAGLKSGSLITAQQALEQGREVFAVPGNICNINSMGTNRLIKDGAKMVLSVEDILEEIHVKPGQPNMNSRGKKAGLAENLSLPAKKVVGALQIEDLLDEELADKTKIPLTQLYEILLDLELKGLIKKSLTGQYRLMA